MKEVYVLCFTLIILLVLYLMINTYVIESFNYCPPDTIKGSAFKSYNNILKSGCFYSVNGDSELYMDNQESGESSDVSQFSTENDKKYCQNSIRAKAIESLDSNVKHWCKLPDY